MMFQSVPWRVRLVVFCCAMALCMAAIWPLKSVQGPMAYVAVAVWFFVFVGVAYFGSAALQTDKIRTAQQRYRRWFVVAMSSYLFTLLGSIAWLKGHEPQGPVLWLVAAAPAVPILWVIALMGLYLKAETDELERAIQVEATLWGTGLLLAVSTVWGFLANAGAAPAPPLFMAFPLFCAGLGLSQPFVRWRYR